MDDGILLPEMVIQLVELKPDTGEQVRLEKVFDSNRLYEAIANGRFEGELILHDPGVKCFYDAKSETETYCCCEKDTECGCHDNKYETDLNLTCLTDNNKDNKDRPSYLKLALQARGDNVVFKGKGKVIIDEEYNLDASVAPTIDGHQIIRYKSGITPFTKDESKRISEFEYQVKLVLNKEMKKEKQQDTVEVWMTQDGLEEVYEMEEVEAALKKYWKLNGTDKDKSGLIMPSEKMFKTYGFMTVAFVFQWDSFSRDHTDAFQRILSEDDERSRPCMGKMKQPNITAPGNHVGGNAKVAPGGSDSDTSNPVIARRRSDHIPKSKLSNAYNDQLVDKEGSVGSSRFSTRWKKYRVCPKIFDEDEKDSIFDFNDDKQIVTSRLLEIKSLVTDLSIVAKAAADAKKDDA